MTDHGIHNPDTFRHHHGPSLVRPIDTEKDDRREMAAGQGSRWITAFAAPRP